MLRHERGILACVHTATVISPHQAARQNYDLFVLKPRRAGAHAVQQPLRAGPFMTREDKIMSEVSELY